MGQWMNCEPCASCGQGHEDFAVLAVCTKCGDPYCWDCMSAHEAECWSPDDVDEGESPVTAYLQHYGLGENGLPMLAGPPVPAAVHQEKAHTKVGTIPMNMG